MRQHSIYTYHIALLLLNMIMLKDSYDSWFFRTELISLHISAEGKENANVRRMKLSFGDILYLQDFY